MVAAMTNEEIYKRSWFDNGCDPCCGREPMLRVAIAVEIERQKKSVRYACAVCGRAGQVSSCEKSARYLWTQNMFPKPASGTR